MDCLETIGIRIEDGFSAYNYEKTLNKVDKLHNSKIVYLTSSKCIYMINKDLYILSDFIECMTLIIFNKNTYDRPKVNEEIKKLCQPEISYKSYDSDNSYYQTLGTIENNNVLCDRINTIVDNIINKISKHKNLTINIILHGLPGTGKSSCVETIATKLGGDIYILPLNSSLQDGVSQLSRVTKSVILIPELDKFILSEKYSSEYEQLLLEFLSGCFSTKNNIVIITCNDYNLMKKSTIMTRPGRVHLSIEFGLVDSNTIKNTVLEYFPDFTNFELFNKYVDKVTVAEFKTAVINNYIMDKPIDSNFNVAKLDYSNNFSKLYL